MINLLLTINRLNLQQFDDPPINGSFFMGKISDYLKGRLRNRSIGIGALAIKNCDDLFHLVSVLAQKYAKSTIRSQKHKLPTNPFATAILLIQPGS